MPRRGLPALALVAALASACATTGPSPVPAAPTASPAGSPGASASTPPAAGLPEHRTVRGDLVDGAFDLATDGTVIVWSDGAIDANAPDLWRLDPATGRTERRYRSRDAGAILAGLAVRGGRIAFSEVTGHDSTSRWRLILLDARGAAHVLDVDDHVPGTAAVLPMVALSDAGVLWATTHAARPDGLSCELRYAAFADLAPRVIEAAPCDRRQFWYPASDGATFVWATVDDAATTGNGTGRRRVWAATDASLGAPRRLDADDAATWPAVRGDLVAWKAAVPPANVTDWAPLTLASLSGAAAPARIEYPATSGKGASAPSIGEGYLAADTNEDGVVSVWDLAASAVVTVDRLPPADPGFVSSVRLAGALLVWFYTDDAAGGGTREIRWLDLAALGG